MFTPHTGRKGYRWADDPPRNHLAYDVYIMVAEEVLKTMDHYCKQGVNYGGNPTRNHNLLKKLGRMSGDVWGDKL